MLCGSRIPVRMRMSSVCLTEKGRTQAAFAPATRAVGRAVWLWSHFTERRQGPAQALVRPGKNGISTQATGHVIKTDDRRGGGRDTRIPTSPPTSSLSPQWVDREKGQTPPIRTPGRNSKTKNDVLQELWVEPYHVRRQGANDQILLKDRAILIYGDQNVG